MHIMKTSWWKTFCWCVHGNMSKHVSWKKTWYAEARLKISQQKKTWLARKRTNAM